MNCYRCNSEIPTGTEMWFGLDGGSHPFCPECGDEAVEILLEGPLFADDDEPDSEGAFNYYRFPTER